MPRTMSFAKQGLLLFFIPGFCTHLIAQTDQQQVVAAANKNFSAAEPVKKDYDEEAKSWYAVYNVNNAIHVSLAITDQAQQRKIIMNGIELWIDTKGKKNKKTGIIFPFNDSNNRPQPPQGQPGTGHPEFFNDHPRDTNNIAALQKHIALHREMKLTGFKEELNGLQNIDHPSGIKVSLYFIKDTLVYEAQLPLNTLAEIPSLHSRIAIGIVEKGMSVNGFGGDGMPSPDSGGPGGDGMMPPPGGGGPPPGGPEGMMMFEDNIIWYKFSL